jgi:hypothetical protein
MQQQGLAPVLRHRRERAVDGLTIRQVLDFGRDRGLGERSVSDRLVPAATRERAPTHEEHVTRDRIDPRPDRAVGQVGVTRAVDLEEGLLKQVLRTSGVTAQGTQVAANLRRQRAVDCLKCRSLARLVSHHERTEGVAALRSDEPVCVLFCRGSTQGYHSQKSPTPDGRISQPIRSRRPAGRKFGDTDWGSLPISGDGGSGQPASVRGDRGRNEYGVPSFPGTLHQVQAGERGDDGWYAARSTEGRFSVRLPNKYNDGTIREASGHAATAGTIYMLSAVADCGCKWVATLAKDHPGIMGAFKQDLERPRRDKSIVASTYKGRVAVEFSAARGSDGTGIAIGRKVLAPDGVLVLSVICPVDQGEYARRDLKKFLDSLAWDSD